MRWNRNYEDFAKPYERLHCEISEVFDKIVKVEDRESFLVAIKEDKTLIESLESDFVKAMDSRIEVMKLKKQFKDKFKKKPKPKPRKRSSSSESSDF